MLLISQRMIRSKTDKTESDEKEVRQDGKKTFIRLPSQWKGILMPPCLRARGVSESNYNRWVLEIMGWLYGERGAPKAWRKSLLRFLFSLSQLSWQLPCPQQL